MSEQENWSVNAGRYAQIPTGIYDAILTKMERTSTTYRGEERELVRWIFTPDGLDTTVSAISSLSPGNKSKAAEWSRRILGMSDDTDMAWGKDAKGKKEPVNWGPTELEGKPCQIKVEVREDAEGNERSNVVNVFKLGSFEDIADPEEIFDSIPF